MAPTYAVRGMFIPIEVHVSDVSFLYHNKMRFQQM